MRWVNIPSNKEVIMQQVPSHKIPTQIVYETRSDSRPSVVQPQKTHRKGSNMKQHQQQHKEVTLHDLNYKDKQKLKMMVKRLTTVEKLLAESSDHIPLEVPIGLIQPATCTEGTQSDNLNIVESTAIQTMAMDELDQIPKKIKKKIKKQNERVNAVEEKQGEILRQLALLTDRMTMAEKKFPISSAQISETSAKCDRLESRLDELETLTNAINNHYKHHQEQQQTHERTILIGDETVKTTGYHRLIDQILDDVERIRSKTPDRLVLSPVKMDTPIFAKDTIIEETPVQKVSIGIMADIENFSEPPSQYQNSVPSRDQSVSPIRHFKTLPRPIDIPNLPPHSDGNLPMNVRNVSFTSPVGNYLFGNETSMSASLPAIIQSLPQPIEEYTNSLFTGELKYETGEIDEIITFLNFPERTNGSKQ